ncbi:MAG: four helix bundle suffix domain-containing protein [Kiritimatiellia bacterium]|jgi:four helix bundle suffix protein
MSHNFLPKKGGYKELLSYQKTVIIYDCTYVFCHRFLSKFDRTVDQMVQAARSGKQNIIEGAKAAVTSSETELKLTNVARASLEELLEDYCDFLRVRKFDLWDKQSSEASYVRKLSSGKIALPKVPGKDAGWNGREPGQDVDLFEKTRRVFVYLIETRPPDVCANIMICLIHQANYLLDRQIEQLEEDFVKQGGLREMMYNARSDYRRKGR